MDITRTHIYEKKASKLLSEDELRKAEDEIASCPEKWPVLQGTGGVRKARASRGNSGKSGGVRVLYYVWLGGNRLYFLDIYPKNEQENISDKDKKILKSIIQTITGDDHDG